MLASIEFNMVDSLVKCEPKIFIYVAIGDHINRLLNLVDYGYHSPRYILDPLTNDVRYMGRFDDGHNDLNPRVSKFQIQNLFQKSQAGLSDVKLFVAMVKKSQKLLLEKYPQSEFHVIFYNYELLVPAMMRELRKAGITVHSILKMVPDYYESQAKYCIHFPSEQHANGKRNKIIANYIVKNILAKK
jgi:hypothetical protein